MIDVDTRGPVKLGPPAIDLTALTSNQAQWIPRRTRTRIRLPDTTQSGGKLPATLHQSSEDTEDSDDDDDAKDNEAGPPRKKPFQKSKHTWTISGSECLNFNNVEKIVLKEPKSIIFNLKGPVPNASGLPAEDERDKGGAGSSTGAGTQKE